jgi:hypothetical protein
LERSRPRRQDKDLVISTAIVDTPATSDRSRPQLFGSSSPIGALLYSLYYYLYTDSILTYGGEVRLAAGAVFGRQEEALDGVVDVVSLCAVAAAVERDEPAGSAGRDQLRQQCLVASVPDEPGTDSGGPEVVIIGPCKTLP